MMNFNGPGQGERARMLFAPSTRGDLPDGDVALGRSRGDGFGRPAELRCQGAPNEPFPWRILKPYLDKSFPPSKK